MLGVLRAGGAGPLDPPALVPAPGLSNLPALVERTREAGLAIDVATSGLPHPLPAGIELAAYRIVQEALTNVMRHANAHHARVQLAYQPHALDITVTDDGTGAGRAPSAGDGHGVIGMRERAALHGGQFTAGPCGCRGYRVHAVLPVAAGQENP
jgi:signal transduction histidine kinase